MFFIEINSSKYPVHWKLEASPENFPETKKWQTLFENESQTCAKRGSNIYYFHIDKTDIFSSFRFSMIGKNSIGTRELLLESFDIYGIFIDPYNQTRSLQNQINRIKPSIHQSTSYQFPLAKEGHLGLFNFFSTCSVKFAFKTFSIVRTPTLENTSVFNMMRWDDSYWISENQENMFFSFMLSDGFVFKLEGYKIRSSEKYFPKSWKVEGITTIPSAVLVDKQINTDSICERNKDWLITVPDDQYFIGFKVTQIGKNAHGTYHFSLSAIEWFGYLITFT